MSLCVATFAVALLWLLSAASCAPPRHACAALQNSSMELNQLAKIASIKARNGDRSESDFTTSLAWIEAKDMCDPQTLKQEPLTCVGKMLSVLQSYSSYVEMISGFECCSEYANIVKPALNNLLTDMESCMSLKAGMNLNTGSHSSAEDPQSLRDSLKPLLCHYILDRLFSFSILAARVFAVGDPTHHSDGSAQKCM